MAFIKKLAFPRVMAIALSLIPAANGLTIFFNNIFIWREEVQRMTVPLLSMEGTNKSPSHMWRAIDSESVAILCHFFVLTFPLLIGVMASIGIARMLRALVADKATFLKGVCLVKYSCLVGLFLWGFLFTVVAGNWFLSWQNPDLSFLHLDGLLYSALVMFVYFSLHTMSKEL